MFEIITENKLELCYTCLLNNGILYTLKFLSQLCHPEGEVNILKCKFLFLIICFTFMMILILLKYQL